MNPSRLPRYNNVNVALGSNVAIGAKCFVSKMVLPANNGGAVVVVNVTLTFAWIPEGPVAINVNPVEAIAVPLATVRTPLLNVAPVGNVAGADTVHVIVPLCAVLLTLAVNT